MMNLGFREWVMNPTKETDLFWETWIKSNPDKNNDLLLAKEIVQKLEFKHVDSKQDSYDRVLQKTLSGQQTYYAGGYHRYFNYSDLKVYLRIAAVLAIASFIYLFYKSNQIQVGEEIAINQNTIIKENSLGRKYQIYLPDGTTVWLNVQSKIEYTQKFIGDSRLVKLTGEAYFDVAKDKSKPFIVETSTMSVTAIGTAFNVRAFVDDDQHQISLAEGKVMVKGLSDANMANGKTFLNPGKALAVLKSNGQIIQSDFNIKKVLSWKDGIIYFEDATFTEVIGVLQRWYGKEFIVNNQGKAGAWKFGSEFHNETLENVMRTISFSENFEYKIEENTVTIIF